MAVTSNIQVMRDGPRNYVVRLTGECVVGDADTAPAVLVNVATMNPPALAVRVDRVKYSMPHGTPLDIQLWWQATTNVLFSGSGGGDDADYWNFGGLTNNAAAGVTGNILWSMSGASGVTAGSTLTFAIIVECVKLQPIYPA